MLDSDAPLDLKIKASMLSDMFTLVGECWTLPVPVQPFAGLGDNGFKVLLGVLLRLYHSNCGGYVYNVLKY